MKTRWNVLITNPLPLVKTTEMSRWPTGSELSQSMVSQLQTDPVLHCPLLATLLHKKRKTEETQMSIINVRNIAMKSQDITLSSAVSSDLNQL